MKFKYLFAFILLSTAIIISCNDYADLIMKRIKMPKISRSMKSSEAKEL